MVILDESSDMFSATNKRKPFNIIPVYSQDSAPRGTLATAAVTSGCTLQSPAFGSVKCLIDRWDLGFIRLFCILD